MKPRVLLLATFDTKGEECIYIKKRIVEDGVECITLNVGIKEPLASPDVTTEMLCEGTEHSSDKIRAMTQRGEAVALISDLAEKYVRDMHNNSKMDAVVGIGGGGGTSIITQVMRGLPIGMPKIMLSTLASGNVRWYVKDSDIIMMPSIMDIAGLNSVAKMVYDKFAAVSAGAAKWYMSKYNEHKKRIWEEKSKKIGMTMYGTTTKCVTRSKDTFEQSGFEALVFHASGVGGMAMEKFILSDVIKGVLDITIAEIGAHIVGGLHDAGPNRMEAAVKKGIPFVLVPGAADTIVLPPLDNVPEKFKSGRILNVHNPTMTTMRTNVEENIKIAEFIIDKIKHAKSNVKILLPKGGLSAIDMPGEIFYLPEANEALFETLKSGLKGTEIEIIEDNRHLYDDGFGQDAARMLIEIIKNS